MLFVDMMLLCDDQISQTALLLVSTCDWGTHVVVEDAGPCLSYSGSRPLLVDPVILMPVSQVVGNF